MKKQQSAFRDPASSPSMGGVAAKCRHLRTPRGLRSQTGHTGMTTACGNAVRATDGHRARGNPQAIQGHGTAHTEKGQLGSSHMDTVGELWSTETIINDAPHRYRSCHDTLEVAEEP